MIENKNLFRIIKVENETMTFSLDCNTAIFVRGGDNAITYKKSKQKVSKRDNL